MERNAQSASLFLCPPRRWGQIRFRRPSLVNLPGRFIRSIESLLFLVSLGNLLSTSRKQKTLHRQDASSCLSGSIPILIPICESRACLLGRMRSSVHIQLERDRSWCGRGCLDGHARLNMQTKLQGDVSIPGGDAACWVKTNNSLPSARGY